MNKKALNAQLVTTWLKRGFYHLKSVWLRKIRCMEKFCFGCKWRV